MKRQRPDLVIPPLLPGEYDYKNPPSGQRGRPRLPEPVPITPGELGQPDPGPVVQPLRTLKHPRRAILKTTTAAHPPSGPATLSERMIMRPGPSKLAELEPILDGAPLPRVRLHPRQYEETIVGEIVAWLRRLRYLRQRNGAPRSVKVIIEAFEILDRMARQALGMSQPLSPSQLNINVVGSRMSQPFEPATPPPPRSKALKNGPSQLA